MIMFIVWMLGRGYLDVCYFDVTWISVPECINIRTIGPWCL